MKKRLLVFLAVALALTALGGCNWWAVAPTLTPLTQSVEIDTTVGSATATWTLAGVGSVLVDFGDGEREQYKLDRGVAVTVTHEYTTIGTYTVIASQGGNRDTAQVTITCEQPVVYVPFWWNGWIVDEEETIHFQVDHREIGCDAGTGVYQYQTGVVPGAGTTEVRLFAWDADGNPIGVFDFRKPLGDQGVWGKWVALPADEVENYVLSVFMNYYDLDTPKLPLAPRAAPLSCPDDIEWTEGPDGLNPGDHNYEYHNKFLLEARNEYTPAGQEPSRGWRIWYTNNGCD